MGAGLGHDLDAANFFALEIHAHARKACAHRASKCRKRHFTDFDSHCMGYCAKTHRLGQSPRDAGAQYRHEFHDPLFSLLTCRDSKRVDSSEPRLKRHRVPTHLREHPRSTRRPVRRHRVAQHHQRNARHHGVADQLLGALPGDRLPIVHLPPLPRRAVHGIHNFLPERPRSLVQLAPRILNNYPAPNVRSRRLGPNFPSFHPHARQPTSHPARAQPLECSFQWTFAYRRTKGCQPQTVGAHPLVRNAESAKRLRQILGRKRKPSGRWRISIKELLYELPKSQHISVSLQVRAPL